MVVRIEHLPPVLHAPQIIIGRFANASLLSSTVAGTESEPKRLKLQTKIRKANPNYSSWSCKHQQLSQLIVKNCIPWLEFPISARVDKWANEIVRNAAVIINKCIRRCETCRHKSQWSYPSVNYHINRLSNLSPPIFVWSNMCISQALLYLETNPNFPMF